VLYNKLVHSHNHTHVVMMVCVLHTHGVCSVCVLTRDSWFIFSFVLLYKGTQSLPLVCVAFLPGRGLLSGDPLKLFVGPQKRHMAYEMSHCETLSHQMAALLCLKWYFGCYLVTSHQKYNSVNWGIYLQNTSAKCHPDPIWNGAFCVLEDRHLNKNNSNNNWVAIWVYMVCQPM